jgi:hypothetical protein
MFLGKSTILIVADHMVQCMELIDRVGFDGELDHIVLSIHLGVLKTDGWINYRMNPCTLGWYLPLLVKDVPGALQPSESKSSTSGGGKRGNDGEGKASNSWQELDAKFRRDLPDELYIGRLAYRGLVMRACSRIRMLDGVGVSEKEERKAQKLLVGILNKTKSKDQTTGKDRGTEGSVS